MREGHIEVARALLEAGVNVNEALQRAELAPSQAGTTQSARDGTSPLMMAVENGHFELAIALVDAGADPNDQTDRIHAAACDQLGAEAGCQ